jgi:putative membrane protein
MMFGDGGWMPAMHGSGWMFVIWVLLVVAAVGLVAALLRRDAGPRETPRQILQRRLASGEITPQEYEQRKALLDRDGPGGG